MNEEIEIPDLYQLAYMPGCFRCPKCGFALTKTTINVATGQTGTTEHNRQSEECPNDGTFMVHVTYREQLEIYAARLKEEFGRIEELTQQKYALEEAIRRCRHGMEGVNGLEVVDGAAPNDSFVVDLSLEIATCEAVVPGPHGASKWVLITRTLFDNHEERIRELQNEVGVLKNDLDATERELVLLQEQMERAK
jgi:hypothetical protein